LKDAKHEQNFHNLSLMQSCIRILIIERRGFAICYLLDDLKLPHMIFTLY